MTAPDSVSKIKCLHCKSWIDVLPQCAKEVRELAGTQCHGCDWLLDTKDVSSFIIGTNILFNVIRTGVISVTKIRKMAMNEGRRTDGLTHVGCRRGCCSASQPSQ